MTKKEPKEKSTFDLVVDTAKDGVIAGVKLEIGAVIAAASIGTKTGTLEEGIEKFKDSTKGCYEIGRRIGKNIG